MIYDMRSTQDYRALLYQSVLFQKETPHYHKPATTAGDLLPKFDADIPVRPDN